MQAAQTRYPLDGSAEWTRFQADPVGYAEQVLGLSPWPGCNDHKGQRELFQDIGDSVRRQIAGDKSAPKTFRVEAGHGVGKTFGAAMLVNWFFDCFPPTSIPGSVTLTTAPTKAQVEELLWKDVKSMRPSALPGRVFAGTPQMEKAGNWWAKGRTTSNNGGQGSARFQGQHNEYFFVVLDEAEGVPDFVFNATRGMMTGCRVVIVLMLANPMTRSSRFHKTGKQAGVQNYRLSVLDHPNVVNGEDTVPGATSREWVIGCVQDWCEVASGRDEDNYTFTLPYDIPPNAEGNGASGPAGTIFLPNSEFLFRVMGVAPANFAGNTFCSPGRYEAARKRVIDLAKEDGTRATIGVDAARFGDDYGTVYGCHKRVARRLEQISKQDGLVYYARIKAQALKYADQGVKVLHIRFDGTGGFASTAIDLLKADADLQKRFTEFRVIEVSFGGGPSVEGGKLYDDIVTEMYAHAGLVIGSLRLESVPEQLEGDLTERTFGFVYREAKIVKRIEKKEDFKKRVVPHRSPDDGDGFVLCVAPDHLFRSEINVIKRPANRGGYGYS